MNNIAIVYDTCIIISYLNPEELGYHNVNSIIFDNDYFLLFCEDTMEECKLTIPRVLGNNGLKLFQNFIIELTLGKKFETCKSGKLAKFVIQSEQDQKIINCAMRTRYPNSKLIVTDDLDRNDFQPKFYPDLGFEIPYIISWEKFSNQSIRENIIGDIKQKRYNTVRSYIHEIEQNNASKVL